MSSEEQGLPFDACPNCGVPVGSVGPLYYHGGSVTPIGTTFECSKCGWSWPNPERDWLRREEFLDSPVPRKMEGKRIPTFNRLDPAYESERRALFALLRPIANFHRNFPNVSAEQFNEMERAMSILVEILSYARGGEEFPIHEVESRMRERSKFEGG